MAADQRHSMDGFAVHVLLVGSDWMLVTARGSLTIQDAKKSPFWHHWTTLSGCIFAAEACIDNRKRTC